MVKSNMMMEYSKRNRLFYRYKALSMVSRVVSAVGFFLLIGVVGGIEVRDSQTTDYRIYFLLGVLGLAFLLFGHAFAVLFEKEMSTNKRWLRRFYSRVR